MLVYIVVDFFLYFMMRVTSGVFLTNLRYRSFRNIAEDVPKPAGGLIAGWAYWFAWTTAAMGGLVAITGYARL